MRWTFTVIVFDFLFEVIREYDTPFLIAPLSGAGQSDTPLLFLSLEVRLQRDYSLKMV
jgi:hypothetical protein